MSVFFEGNALIDQGQFQSGNITTSTISNCSIIKTSIDMLDSSGNLQFITNVKDPIQPQDAATKKYVDDLGIINQNVTLIGTLGSMISSSLSGSYVITVKNLVINGPSAIFNITKNEAFNTAQFARIVSAPGTNSRTALYLKWDVNEPLYLFKNSNLYDGSYSVKII